jgi:UDP-N-acetylmuramoyl-tripeptide--D-alanyl-D-alanine ligase
MHPQILPNGAIMLRDDYNGSIDSFERAIDVLRDARVERRILVVSDCSDLRRKPHQRQQYFGKVASGASDLAVFVGERSGYAVRSAVANGMDQSCVHACFSLDDAAELLRRELRAGDLVLLRGRTQDHLARIYFQVIGSVDCKLIPCRKRCLCDECEELGFRADNSLNAPDAR